MFLIHIANMRVDKTKKQKINKNLENKINKEMANIIQYFNDIHIEICEKRITFENTTTESVKI